MNTKATVDQATWTIVTESYSQWANRWSGPQTSGIDVNTPNVRNIVLLALLEKQDAKSSYDDLQKVIAREGVVEGEIPKENLRVAVLELRGKLAGTSLQLQSDRSGRDAVFQLRRRKKSTSGGRADAGSLGDQTYEVVTQFESDNVDPSYLACSLVRDGALHHTQLYILPKSASYWTTYSENETFARTGFEHEAYETLFAEWLEYQGKVNSGGISLLGLNVGGEGEAEITILRDLLGRFNTVHYLAIDLSARLLTDHVSYLKHHFGEEIKTGRLLCAAKAGSFEEETHATTAISEVRYEFARRYSSLGEFFPEEYPILCTYLSNYIGNKSKAGSEWDTFRTVLSVFPRQVDHAFFVGFAAIRRDQKGDPIQEEYTKDWFDFLAQTPRELLYTNKTLTSEQPIDSDYQEFKICASSDDEFQQKYGDHFALDVKPYEGAEPIRGQRYRFTYKTRWPLKTEYEGKTYRLEAGQDLRLYTIVKFLPDTLREFLERRHLTVTLSERDKAIGTGRFEHRYGLLAAIQWFNRNSPNEPGRTNAG
jgi:hypothetical protein